LKHAVVTVLSFVLSEADLVEKYAIGRNGGQCGNIKRRADGLQA